jgi:hypothetical protein
MAAICWLTKVVHALLSIIQIPSLAFQQYYDTALHFGGALPPPLSLGNVESVGNNSLDGRVV